MAKRSENLEKAAALGFGGVNGKEKSNGATVFAFIDADGATLFTAPERAVLSGIAYDEALQLRNGLERQQREAAPVTFKLKDMGQQAMGAEEGADDQKEYLREFARTEEARTKENRALEEIRRQGEYQWFLLSLDLRGLTVAQRKQVDTLTNEDGTLTDFWKWQNIEELRVWGERFRSRVGVRV